MRWSELTVWTFVNPFRTEEEAAAGRRAQQALNEYSQRMIDERRRAPCEDLIMMSMLQARDVSDRLIDAEIVMQCSLLLAAANHDPTANVEPERFDIGRVDIQRQSFGGCKHLRLGAPLARAEAQAALAVLLERFPRLAPSRRGFNYRSTPSFRGLAEYWVQ